MSFLTWSLLMFGLFGTWYLTLAPSTLGGPSTVLVVQGISMEPLLTRGDVLVAHRIANYQRGDLVVLHLASDEGGVNGTVIHRLVSGSAEAGWRTKGDNNDWVDPWTVADSQIAGRYWFSVAGAGTVVAWVATHQLEFGGLCAGLVLATYLPRRRRRLSPVLREALAAAEREPRGQGRPGVEYVVLGISGSALLTSVGLAAVLGVNHRLQSTDGIIAALALGWAGAFTWFFMGRLFDGMGLPEPTRSHYALSGKLWRVGEFPALDTPARQVSSPVELRGLADKYRLPVLHRIDETSGRHEYLLITAREGALRWSPAGPAQHRKELTELRPAA